MSTEGLNRTPALAPRVLAERLWGDRDLFVIDVGASGGIGWYWQPFADRLRAVGFEPLVAEAERLQQLAKGSNVRYEAAFVTCRDFDTLFPPAARSDRIHSRNNDPFQRVSAVRAHALLQMNYVEQVFNAGAPATYTERHVVLSDYIPRDEHEAVDFIKIDTDGHDFQVLVGADELLQSGGVLGFSVEAQFHGASHDYANTFANIDRFLRARGFSLFDLQSYRYSRAALPAPFAYNIPAQTVSGQVLWGEAVYFRDLGSPDYERMWPYEVTRERVVKLACLYDLFGLPDCAAELLVSRRDLVGDAAANALLDDLAAAQDEPGPSYAEYIRRFEASPESMYPNRRARAPQAATPPAAGTDTAAAAVPVAATPVERASADDASQQRYAAELKLLRKRIERQEKKITELHARVRRREARIEELTRSVGAAKKR